MNTVPENIFSPEFAEQLYIAARLVWSESLEGPLNFVFMATKEERDRLSKQAFDYVKREYAMDVTRVRCPRHGRVDVYRVLKFPRDVTIVIFEI